MIYLDNKNTSTPIFAILPTLWSRKSRIWQILGSVSQKCFKRTQSYCPNLWLLCFVCYSMDWLVVKLFYLKYTCKPFWIILCFVGLPPNLQIETLAQNTVLFVINKLLAVNLPFTYFKCMNMCLGLVASIRNNKVMRDGTNEHGRRVCVRGRVWKGLLVECAKGISGL